MKIERNPAAQASHAERGDVRDAASAEAIRPGAEGQRLLGRVDEFLRHAGPAGQMLARLEDVLGDFVNIRNRRTRRRPQQPTPETLERVLRPLVEQLAENEALTSNLQDAEGRRALQWGEARAEQLARQALALSDPGKRQAFLDEGMSALRRRLREVNRQMADAYDAPEPPAERLERLLAAADA